MREFHVLNLGAGVQSTTIKLMEADGELYGDDGLPISFNVAIFSDTGEEPKSVYEHLDWLESAGGCPIVRTGIGKLGDDLINGQNSTGQRFAAIPAFTRVKGSQSVGITRRQCTKEYKIEPIERWIRRELIGLKPRQRMPSDVVIHQYMGFSTDEPGRAARARLRFSQIRWGKVHFPLFFDEVWMSRSDCKRYLEKRCPHPVPRSACVFCPFKSNREWMELRDNDHEGWERAVFIDNALRTTGSVANRDMNAELFVHRSAVPLEDANLGDDQPSLFDMECEGGCGL